MSGCTWLRMCTNPATRAVWRETRPGLIVDERVCDKHLADALARGYRADPSPVPSPDTLGHDDLRRLARELLDAEAAYRAAPTLANSHRLGRVRHRLEAVLGPP